MTTRHWIIAGICLALSQRRYYGPGILIGPESKPSASKRNDLSRFVPTRWQAGSHAFQGCLGGSRNTARHIARSRIHHHAENGFIAAMPEVVDPAKLNDR